jgi:hypothetical protein
MRGWVRRANVSARGAVRRTENRLKGHLPSNRGAKHDLDDSDTRRNLHRP